MDNLFFIPVWPALSSGLIGFAAALLAAVVLGELAQRLFRLPPITGYVIAGVLSSPLLTGATLQSVLHQARPALELAFGLLIFELGQRIDLGWLRRNPWLAASSLAESSLAFLCVGALLTLFDVPPVVSLFTAGMAVATGPAVILGVCGDLAARGQVTDRLHLLCALSTCYGFLVIGLAYAWQHYTQLSGLTLTVLHPLYLVAGSVALGGVIAWAMLILTTRIQPRYNGQVLASIALLVSGIALAHSLNVSAVIALLSAGVLSRTLDRKRRLQPMDFGLIGRLALITMFVATGALLKPASFATALLPAVGILAARALGKTCGLLIFARPSGLSLRKAGLLSIGMLPMSGAALLWVERTAAIWPGLGEQMAATVLSALLIMELLAPPAVQFALRRADETRELV